MRKYPQKTELRSGWLAAARHEIRDGRIVGIVDKGVNKNPMPPFRAAQQLVFAHHGVISLIEFADHCGLLGHSRIVMKEQDRRSGDPLQWFQAHAKTVSALVELIGVYQSPPSRPEFFKELRGAFAFGEQIKPLGAIFMKAKPSAERAYDRIRLLLNDNIHHIHREFRVHPGLSVFKPRALIEAIYWELADLADRPGRVPRRCVECKHFFIAEDPRQRWCPPPAGSTRSRCSSKYNVREHRRRQLEGEGS